MTCSIVALRNVDTIIHATLERFVDGNRGSSKPLFYLTKTLVTGLKLKMIIAGRFCDSRDYSDPVAFWTDVVGRGDDGNVNVYAD